MADGGVWIKIHPDDAGGGAPGAAVIGGATGAVTESSFTESGQAYDVYEFTGSGDLTVTTPGLADVLVVGSGGGGWGSGGPGGGAGGMRWGSFEVDAITHTITVGAGGASKANGQPTAAGEILKVGGGSKGERKTTFADDGLGGGGMVGGLLTQAGTNPGGGAGGFVYGSSNKDGIVINYDNTNTMRGVGGWSASDGDANTGNGGGINGAYAGGSGIVIVRVKVPTESYPFRTKTTAPRTAHAARIEDGIVRQVIVIPHLDDDDQKITEYCNRIGLPGTWVDTSYTGARRGKYAGVGDTFVGTKSGGEFVSPVVEEISE